MKRYLVTGAGLLGFLFTQAQLPEDALRYSYFPQQGTARNAAIGGAMGSLGGDITAMYVNPAGLAFYKTREVVISPGLAFNSNKTNYRGTNEKAKKSGFNLGTSGLVIGFGSPQSKWTNHTFSIGITQTANFNNYVSYKGKNNQSSFAEQYAEQWQQSGLNDYEALNTYDFAYGTAPAIYTYLVDTFRNTNGNVVIKALPEFLLAKGIALNQQKTIKTTGGIYEVALGFASNMDDKLYLGASLGIPIINYTRLTTFNETDPTGDNNNNFGSFNYFDYLTTKGFGLNAKLGIIYKPADQFRLGLSIHTPTFYSLTDRENSSLTTDTEGYEGVRHVTSDTFTLNNLPGKTLYTATTPAKFILSGSYVFREVNDTRLQRGFITFDVEYIGYGSTSFKADGESVSADNEQYYSQLKSIIKDSYKGSFNYRLGGELKFNTVMVRLGGSYYSNPYRKHDNSDNIKSSIMQASGGLGYRNRGMFIDLTYMHAFTKDVNFPYLLTDKENTYADQKNTRSNLLLTVGFKF